MILVTSLGSKKCCAIFRTTSHITQLYESTNPQQPFIYHGNSCAHEVNVVSIASVLPGTPGDINSILTVIFISSRKFNHHHMVSLSIPNAKSTLVAHTWAPSPSPHQPPSGLLRLVQPHGPVPITPDWTHWTRSPNPQ